MHEHLTESQTIESGWNKALENNILLKHLGLSVVAEIFITGLESCEKRTRHRIFMSLSYV